jgi:cytochrome b involved in lipid metabolism
MLMKKEIIIGAVGVIAIVFLVGSYAIQYNRDSNTTQSIAEQQNTVAGITDTNASAALTLAEIAKHNIPADCYMIISGKVYSVGSYINSHPGGAQAITSFCGKDGTVAFETKGGKGSHSPSAATLLGKYYIGDLNSQITPQTQAKIQNAANILPTSNERENEREYEDD